MVAYRALRLTTLGLVALAAWSLAASRGLAGSTAGAPLVDLVVPGESSRAYCEHENIFQKTGPIRCELRFSFGQRQGQGFAARYAGPHGSVSVSGLADDPRLRMLTSGDRVQIHVTVERLSEPDQAGGNIR